MKTLGAITDHIYNQYNSPFNRLNITFNLDISDRTLPLTHPDKLSAAIKLYFDFIIKNHPGCEITISAQANQIVIKDNNYFFSVDNLQHLNQELQKLIPHATLRTRIGFGATLTLPLI